MPDPDEGFDPRCSLDHWNRWDIGLTAFALTVAAVAIYAAFCS